MDEPIKILLLAGLYTFLTYLNFRDKRKLQKKLLQAQKEAVDLREKLQPIVTVELNQNLQSIIKVTNITVQSEPFNDFTEAEETGDRWRHALKNKIIFTASFNYDTD